MRDRKELYLRIEERVDKMLKSGFLNEVKDLLKSGCSSTAKPFQSLGYRQILSHLQGDLSLDEAVGLIKKNTKRYAKRQLTWFRKDSEIKWFTLPPHSCEINEEIRKFLKI